METRRLGPLATPAGQHVALALGVLAVFGMIFVKAWVCEDAYITFRVIDNFLHGYGLRWNIHERVQVFTHPLWMLLHIPLNTAWPNIFLANISLSLVCALATLLIPLATGTRRLVVAACFFLLPIAASKTMIEYSTSGLENPLTHLLFAVFGYVMVKHHAHRFFWFYCSLIVGLSVMNRFDTALIYAPVLVYLVVERFRPIAWRQIIVGALPLLAWLAFSLLYYGFIFPNTKYAKLNTGHGLDFYLMRGTEYFRHLVVFDTAGTVMLFSSLFFILFPTKGSVLAPKPLSRLPQFLAFGVLAYSLYVIYVGGDYMDGRFWSLPVFASIWLAYMFFPYRQRPDHLFATGCLILTAAFTPPLLVSIRQSCSQCLPIKMQSINAISTFGKNRLFKSFNPPAIRKQGHYAYGRMGRDLAQNGSERVIKGTYVGMLGYYAGPRALIIDKLALADPLLARLPAIKRRPYYNGHFYRHIPKGYPHAAKTGSTEYMPRALGEYYKKLRIITSGDLFDGERLKTILQFNLGYYDGWKQRYLTNTGQ